jgi:uncharacterized protein with von Willebrand factor type A (vWA) domain
MRPMEHGYLLQFPLTDYVTPKGMRKIGSKALRDLFSSLAKDKPGQHQQHRFGQGHERTYDTKQYEYGDPFNLDLQRTILNALRRGGVFSGASQITSAWFPCKPHACGRRDRTC